MIVPAPWSNVPLSVCPTGYRTTLQFLGVVVTQPSPIAPASFAEVPVPEKNVGAPPPTDLAPA